METIKLLWPVVTGALIVPLVNWYKKNIPTNFPIQPILITTVLSISVMWGLSEIFAPSMPWVEIIGLALGANVTAQVVHESTKRK